MHIHRHTLWADSSSIDNHEQFTSYFSNFKIGYDTAQTCVHVWKLSHYINKVKNVAKPHEKLYRDTQFCSSCLPNR